MGGVERTLSLALVSRPPLVYIGWRLASDGVGPLVWIREWEIRTEMLLPGQTSFSL